MYRKIIKNLLLVSLVNASYVYAEFSPFGSNDNPPANEYNAEQRGMSAPSEYSEEQRSIPAKQVIIQNRKTITELNRRVGELEMRLEGLTSLIEGLNVTIAEMKTGNSFSAQQTTQTPQAAGKNGNTALIKELGVMIDKINASYVSKEELQKVLDGKKISSSKNSVQKELPSKSSANESFESKPTSKIYSEGVRLFVKRRYDEAAKRFTITDKKNYKPAASNYYLGEIAYYTKKYEDAIFYYKKSASLYDQASYIDVLLLHTAISLEKTGDKSQAKTFYKNIIDNYPGKKSAQIAKSKLKKL